MMKNILSELRALDFTRVLSGPHATRILADFGAEVIKVQSKKIEGTEPNTGGYFDTWNRNKRSITLDMSHPEAREIALRLVAICDVVIENFSSRVMLNWGMDFQKLKEARPDIIMLSMSGMGQTGPWKNHVAFGPTVQSLGGLTYLTSFEENFPLGSGYALADHISGLYGAFAILAALEHRDRTGQGQYIDLSQYEVASSQIGPALLDVLANNQDLHPCGNQPDYVMAAPHGCYRCLGKDQWCVIGVFNEVEWQALVHALGNPGWANDSKYASLARRKEHFNQLDEDLNKWTLKHTAQEVVELLQNAGVPAGVVQNAQELANDPHLLDRNFFIQIEHPSLGKTISDRSPIKFIPDSPTDPYSEVDLKSAPLLGEGNQYVYMDLLGLTEQEYTSYIQKGIIA
jgi:crotonobetainyl-CoA:carnitine CoA-transferase CaiB-like acyl-CoA transferase